MKNKICRNGLFLLFIIFILSTGCGTTKGDYTDSQEASYSESWGITLEQYNCSIDFPEEDVCLSIADDILNGRMIVLWSSDEAPEYDTSNMDDFNWEIQYSSSPNTFQLYLQCLNPVAFLTKGYELSGNESYLLQAQSILESWIKYKNSKPKDNPFLWYDHGTALRAENLIYYALVCEKADKADAHTKSIIYSLLEEHGKFLADNDNYTANHNHGIFQDRALIYISYFLNNSKSEEWCSLAKERVFEQYNYAFNSESVHVENSPGYAYGVMELFMDISDFLAQFNDSDGEKLRTNIYNSAEFLSWMMKPNGLTAEIGDTNSMPDYERTYTSDESKYGNEHLIYASTQGNEGERPSLNSIVYPVSGYYIAKDWNAGSFSDSTWCMFKAGYSSKTHKHADDCSFMLYSKGYDIFTDPGWYNYITGNKYRDYFVSSKAHNTVIVDGKTYSATVENSTKTGIIDYNLSDNYDYVLGFNDMYNGVEIDRHFYHMGDAIILFDDISASEEHEYSQLFQLSEVMKVVSYDASEVVMSLADTGYIVRIRQVGNIHPSLEIIAGTEETDYGHISRALNLLDTTTTLKYDLHCSSGAYITIITIEDKNGVVHLSKNGLSNDDLFVNASDILYNKTDSAITIGDVDIALQPRERFEADDVSLSIDDNVLSAYNNTVRDDLTYAYYLIDKTSATAIVKTDYSTDPSFKYELPKGEYLLKAYVRSSNGQRKSKIVADIINANGNSAIIINDDKAAYNLDYKGHTVKALSENTYSFTLDFDYSWNFNVKWYIYKNGGYYTSFNSTEKSMEYTFDEPGNYTVMYYLTTPNGDNEFWNFPIILIN